MRNSSLGRPLATVIALIAYGALVLQYVLLVTAAWQGTGPWQATIRFFSFFTILSNLLVALTAGAAALELRPCLRAFGGPRLRGLAALCIGITCGIYFFVLSALWSPRGAQWLADILLHYVVPVLYLSWWAGCAPHGRLKWSDALRWLLFPLAFLAWTLARGAWVHEYPYPFVDVDALGVAIVARNVCAIAALFLMGGLVLVAFDRAFPRPDGKGKARSFS